MGCWSESCALSGMELDDGRDIYLATMEPADFSSEVTVIVPPTRGVYDDYGGITLSEDNAYPVE
ncbi:MAG: hypothetical protein JJ979_02580 [Roseibium sp.]|nr:hypothetical protein [Roseibium sp.]